MVTLLLPYALGDARSLALCAEFFIIFKLKTKKTQKKHLEQKARRKNMFSAQNKFVNFFKKF